MDSVPTGDESDETIVSVSTAFNADAHFDPLPPDLIIVSSNSVIFYVHSHIVHYSSDLNSPIRPPTPPSESYAGYNALSNHQSLVKHVSESADVLNIILHTAYNVSCAQYFPSFHDLTTAVKTLSRYGVDPKTILPNTALYAVLLSHAPMSSLDLYALAAHYDLYDLAVATSPHLLSLSLCTLTDEMATRIGPVYLRRLFFLHLGRADALRRVLRAPPHTHTPTSTCGPAEQKNLATAWALTASYLTWDPRPGRLSHCLVFARADIPNVRSLNQCYAGHVQCFEQRDTLRLMSACAIEQNKNSDTSVVGRQGMIDSLILISHW